MKIERDDIPSIARGRISKQNTKSSNTAMIVLGICVMAALFIKGSSTISVGLILVGGAYVLWNIYNLGNKRKQLTKTLLEEYDKDNLVKN